MDSHTEIRQMMAEQKFSAALLQLRALLSEASGESRTTLLSLTLDCLQALQREPTPELIFEYVQKILRSSPSEAEQGFEKIKAEPRLQSLRSFQLLAMQMADRKGRLAELKSLISRYQIECYERSHPSLHPLVLELTNKYFRNDFSLKLQKVAVFLSTSHSKKAEDLCREILLGVHERTLSKRVHDMLQALQAVLSVPEATGMLTIYRNYCLLALEGITSKKDYKTLAEFVIIFDEYELQVLLLQLLHKLELAGIAAEYAELVRSHKDYDFVYIDKHFPEIKYYFVSPAPEANAGHSTPVSPDITLDERPLSLEEVSSELRLDEPEDAELRMIQLLRHQDYSFRELTHLAVSFLQSDLPKAAREAAEKALSLATNDEAFLRCSYLRISALMRLSDFRAALDMSWQALQKTSTQDDLLSMLYTQAECYLKLHQQEDARRILKKIVAIDANYRMAGERLEKLNEA